MSSWGEEGLKTRWMERKRGRQAREDVEMAELVVREGPRLGLSALTWEVIATPERFPETRSGPFMLQLLRSQEASAAALGAFLGLFHLPDDGLGASLRPRPSGRLRSSQAWPLGTP